MPQNTLLRNLLMGEKKKKQRYNWITAKAKHNNDKTKE